MACPTCDHTVQQVELGVYWCPRCGTLLRGDIFAGSDTAVPTLVSRCREYQDIVRPAMPEDFAEWDRLGIGESINTPADRWQEPEDASRD